MIAHAGARRPAHVRLGAASGLLLLAVAASAFSAPAQAQRRSDTTAMTCAAAQALVARAGAIVVGMGGPTYDRVVLHRGYCTRTEQTEPAYARTLDNRACYIGNLCIERDNSIQR